MKELYLQLLRDTLCGETYDDVAVLKPPFRQILKWLLPKLHIGRRVKTSSNRGDYWPLNAMTMVGKKRLDNFGFCIESVLSDKVPGAIVECGVWRGGSSIYAKGVLTVLKSDKNLYLCDSFEGLPKSIMRQDLAINWTRSGDYLGVDLDTVKDNFSRHHLLDDKVKFLKGWFKDTLPKFPEDKIAVLRCDGDMYESTMDILTNLYPKVQAGGFVIIDDWFIPCCQSAFKDYFGAQIPAIVKIDDQSVYFRKIS